MVKEIVLAIDPALKKIEEILLWKNKFKTGVMFTFCHFLFWFFQNFNIRTYCTISCLFLFMHLLDAYRTKKRREIIRLQSKQNIIESISSLGRYILFIYDKFSLLFRKLKKLKNHNRLLYFSCLLLFWSMAAVIGVKIRGFYLSYFVFWIIFFVPAILHYEIPKKILRRALPVLEQLDQSMKYERRSILDKKELLVDVKLPQSFDQEDQEQEDEYLSSFQLGDLESMKDAQRKVFENLDDDDFDEDEDEVENEEEEEISEEIIEEVYQTHRINTYSNNKNPNQNEIYHYSSGRQNKIYSSGEEEDEESNLKMFKNIKNSNKSPTFSRKNKIKKDLLDMDADDDDVNSFLPDESLPNLSDVGESYIQSSNDEQFISESIFKNVQSGDKQMKRRIRNRPSLLDYYGESVKNDKELKNSKTKKTNNEQDIDETFDFLDEELNKYDD